MEKSQYGSSLKRQEARVLWYVDCIIIFTIQEANITPQHKYEYIPYPDKKVEKVGREILCLLFDFIPGNEGGGYIYAAGTTGCVYVHKLHNQREPEYIATISVFKKKYKFYPVG